MLANITCLDIVLFPNK